jgi:hypothetical protein
VHGRVRAPLTVALLLTVTVAAALVGGCGKRDPIDGVWSYEWGTPLDSILTDSADIQHRLGRHDFRMTREPYRLAFDDVQFGMGYDRVVLDFDSEGRLWHGRARTAIESADAADSIIDSWHDRYGRETADRRIGGPDGYSTWWRTAIWLDRHFYAAQGASGLEAGDVLSIDLFGGGCLSGCPLYSVRLYPDGRALLRSIRDFEPSGCFRGEWDPALFGEMAQDGTSPEFVSLAGFYGHHRKGGHGTLGARIVTADREVSAQSAESAGPPLLENYLVRLQSVLDRVEWTTQLVRWDTLRLGDEHAITLDSLATLAFDSLSD